MPSVRFMNSEQTAWFDDPSLWYHEEFLICMKFQVERDMYYLLHHLFSYLSIQDMEALYIAIPPMRATIFHLMERISHSRVRYLVDKQINRRLMDTLYNLATTDDASEMDILWSRCWEHWKLIIDTMDLKTNYLINFSGVMEQTEQEIEMGCMPINWADPAGVYQTKYEILTINIIINGAIISSYIHDDDYDDDDDEEAGERKMMAMCYSFCGHVITKDATRLRACMEGMLNSTWGLLSQCRVKYDIQTCGELLKVKPFHGKQYHMMKEFVTQGLLTEEDLAKRECTIYDDDGRVVKYANREKSFYCLECMTIHDGYGQRRSSAVGVVAAWGGDDDPSWLLPKTSDIISGNRFWMSTRQHTTRPSTANRRLFRRGRLTFGDPFEYAYRLR